MSKLLGKCLIITFLLTLLSACGNKEITDSMAVKDKSTAENKEVINEDTLNKTAAETTPPASTTSTATPIPAKNVKEAVTATPPQETQLPTATPPEIPTGWVGDHYFDEQGNMVTNDWVDNYFLDKDGYKVEINEGGFVEHGLQIITNDFYFTIPESWSGRILMNTYENYWSVNYAESFQFDGKIEYFPVLMIEACTSRESADQAAGMMDSHREYDGRDGIIYITGGRTDTVDPSFFTEEQHKELRDMCDQSRSVQDTFVVRK